MRMRFLLRAGTLAAMLALAGPVVQAQSVAPGKVVVAGDVPDESTRQAILARVRELYGPDRVIDQLGVRSLAAPPNWAQHVQRVLHPDLKNVTRGQLDIRGNVVEIRGEVTSDAQRQQVLSQLRSQLSNPTYTVRNGLRVTAAGQEQLDAALANRIVEFEPGSATLTATGQQVLNDLAGVIKRMPDRRFEIIGHTDAQGARLSNLALSAARADAVKSYLTAQGVPAALLGTSGAGPDRPVASNDTAEGRARNRRIEVRAISQ
ncbi:OmpA/MotB family outer membrane protein [Rubrivivax gelatinosus IL144]|uniref:OmpA/MotB family outer membrane protein n=2 Tax=Rubrivivax gelatinosus TaxID=28068 RepID=I0HSD9_RUBGI|nr:OmpA/MotB family outer membrane protein [Rubrivivax gelatinosus IL144]